MSVVVSLILLAGGGVAESGSACSVHQIATGECSVDASIDNGGVVLDGESANSGDSTLAGDTNNDSPSSPDDDPFADCDNPNSTTCIRPFIATVTSPVTLSDIATFHPTPAVDHSQPNGWTVIGLDTNFYATGGQHVVDGILLGQPASVRFTPVQWNWDYGDGTAGARDTPGSPWATRTAEFGPTPTSHVYRQRGTFVVALDVDFAAEYRYAGGSWTPIAGTLTIPADPLALTVGDAKTVLVEHNCRQDPAGPGC